MDTEWKDIDQRNNAERAKRIRSKHIAVRLKKGEEKELIITDKEPIGGDFHSISKDDKSSQFVRCPGEFECLLCRSNFKKISGIAVGVIDKTGYETQDGFKVPNMKSPWVLGPESSSRLVRKIIKKFGDKDIDLRKWVISAFRSNDQKSPSCGEDFEIVRQVEPTELDGIDIAPLDKDAVIPIATKDFIEKLLEENETIKDGKTYGTKAPTLKGNKIYPEPK